MTDINSSRPVDQAYAQPGQFQSKSLQEVTQDFVVKTDAFVQPFIEAFRSQHIPCTPVHHHHYSYGWYPRYRSHHPIFIANNKSSDSSSCSSSSSKKHKQDKGLAIAATIAALIAVYTVGSSVARYENARQDLSEVKEFQQMLEAAKENPDENQALIFHGEQAAGLKERICKRMKNSAALDTLLRVSMLGGLITTAASAYIGETGIVNGSLVANLVTGSFIMLKLGYDALSNANTRDAQSLQAKLLPLR